MEKLPVKLILYVVFILGMIVFGVMFSMEYSRRPKGDVTDSPLVQTDDPDAPKTPKLPPEQPNHFMLYLSLFLGCGIGAGIMAARDLSGFIGQEAMDFVFNDDGAGQRNPDYEAAEMMAVNGNPLEAINMMRDYYNRNPREVYVALRIAELYETGLHNALAAALEYEEIIKKKLPSERWGWAAIHLSNLYSGELDKPEQAVALLHRILKEHPKTAAAKKARERLGIAEDAPEGEMTALPKGFRSKSGEEDHDAPASERAAGGEAEAEAAAEAAAAALPAGFRPKTAANTHLGPASETAGPVQRADAKAAEEEAAAPKLPPGFRPKES